jgi:hypothetical protein
MTGRRMNKPCSKTTVARGRGSGMGNGSNNAALPRHGQIFRRQDRGHRNAAPCDVTKQFHNGT